MIQMSKTFMGLCAAVLLGLTSLLWAVPAQAQLKVLITEGHTEPTPIAIPSFLSGHPETDKIARDMAKVITEDLERSGLFVVIDPATYIETQTNIDYQPRFANWRLINAKALVSGRIVRVDNTRLKAEYRLWDIYGRSQLEGLVLVVTEDNWRRVAHKISDSIYKKLTGETGYFDSRVAFISESGPKTNRMKRLTIMDQDGHNPKYLLGGDDLVLTPRFSPFIDRDRHNRPVEKLTYLSWETGRPQVFLLEVETGKRELLGDFPSMTMSPRFSPDGKNLIFTLIKKGNSDIYVMNLRSRSTKRLTTDRAIDVSPSFSPDGRRIVFNSDRGGSPQLYTMNADGSNVKRLSFGKGRYTAPTWSPRGDLVAFTKSEGGQFHIGVMNAKTGKGEKMLTSSYLDEGPTWSPNGRVILFTRETRGANGKSHIWSIDLTGKNLRKLPTPGAASDPAWSPLLP